jgi:NTE family protein
MDRGLTGGRANGASPQPAPQPAARTDRGGDRGGAGPDGGQGADASKPEEAPGAPGAPAQGRGIRRINVALQGGGAHGAFTWGVLDRLLQEERLEIAGISGTSAGALNGAALKAGLVAGGASGGRQAAREKLDGVWRAVGAVTDPHLARWMSVLPPLALSTAIEMSPGYQAADTWARAVSPYMRAPGADMPLRRILEGLDFVNVCADAAPDLTICATNVRTGKIKLFRGTEITVDAILASACLPTLYPAVEIDGEAYWDGGYTGNPALFPLFGHELPDDILVVSINPLYRHDVPITARDIQNRINEISFNTSLLRELRAIEFVQRLLDAGKIEEGAMKRVFVHMISDDALMRQLSVATKLVPNPAILHQLHQAGRRAASAFLAQHGDDIGQRSSVDLPKMFA